MELEGDSPAPRPFPAPEPAATQNLNLNVAPDNVVALAVMFRDCANLLQQHLRRIGRVAQRGPWMADPVSQWVMEQFDKYFFDDEHAFVKIFQAKIEQHTAMRDALVAAAQRYGLTEELNAAGFVDLAPK